ncbi:MAG: DUF4399 domain-containing protein [Lentisphaeraceae bacterium]|nr:DUF4399 domain-containing protein [Lentisphaeraceae bacterium]
MIKKVLFAGLLLSAVFALYAGNTKEEVKAKIDCDNGCCTATAVPTQAAPDPLKRSERADDAEVYIISPKDGDVVGPEVQVIFGLKGMGVAPAGINLPNTGHHHLLVDLEKLPSMSTPIPSDKNHMHFGKGQTETTLKLAPGKHTLQLLLGNFLHIPHAKEVISKKITITVK